MKYKIEADRQEEVLNRQKVDDLLSEAADDSALSHLSAEELHTRRTQLSDALQDIIEWFGGELEKISSACML